MTPTADDPDQLRVRVERLAGHVRVTVSAGAIDIVSAPAFANALAQAADEAGSDDVVVDLSGCDFMDSSGLVAIIKLHQELLKKPGRLALACPESSAPSRMLRLTVNGVIPLFGSTEDALAFLGDTPE